MFIKGKFLAAILSVLLLATAGCASGTDKSRAPAGTAMLLVTRDYGREVIAQKRVEVKPGQTVFEIMALELELDTAYGGQFVNGINGLKSGFTGMRGAERRMVDWFYFINGVAADTGPHDQLARPGQVVWWDYREWETAGMISAVTGAFPEPFVQGYTDKPLPVTVFYAQGREKEAGEVRAALLKAGAAEVGLLPLSAEVALRREGPSLVVGLWSEVSEFPSFRELNERGARLGLYAYYHGEGVSLLFPDGSVARNVTGAGSITAAGAGLGDGKPLWLVLGTDEAGLNRAVAALADGKDVLPGRYGVWTGPEGVFTLPVKE